MENESPDGIQSPAKTLSEPSLRRSWKGYFFEFFMLFLAVLLGFFVENQRENYSEHHQELQYIKSMTEDLKKDLAFFDMVSSQERRVAEIYDSIIFLFSRTSRSEQEQQRLYFLARLVPYSVTYLKINDRTYEQMKGSGNLRLIGSESVSSQISEYYFNSKEIQNNSNESILRIQRMLEAQGKLFDARIFKDVVDMKNFTFHQPAGYPKLITEDSRIIDEYLMSLHYVVSISSFSGQFINQLKVEAKKLTQTLQREYGLGD